MDITYPRSPIARLAGIAAALVTRTAVEPASGCMDSRRDRAVELPPLRRREQRSSEFAGAEFLRASIGPLGPYLGVLCR